MSLDPRPEHRRGYRGLYRRAFWALRAALVVGGVALITAGSVVVLRGGGTSGQESVSAPDATGRALVTADPALAETVIQVARALRSPAGATPLAPDPAAVAPGEADDIAGDGGEDAPAEPTPPSVVRPPQGDEPAFAPTSTPQPAPPPPTATPVPPTAAPPTRVPPTAVPPTPVPPTLAPPTATPVVVVAPVTLNSLEAQFLAATNAQRQAAGLPPLALDGDLVRAARYRSADMAANNYFSHNAPDGSTVFDLLDQWGVPYAWAGENLARNNYPVGECVDVAVRELFASAPHRQNILNSNYTRIGVGYAVDADGMHYFTTVFAG